MKLKWVVGEREVSPTLAAIRRVRTEVAEERNSISNESRGMKRQISFMNGWDHYGWKHWASLPFPLMLITPRKLKSFLISLQCAIADVYSSLEFGQVVALIPPSFWVGSQLDGPWVRPLPLGKASVFFSWSDFSSATLFMMMTACVSSNTQSNRIKLGYSRSGPSYPSQGRHVVGSWQAPEVGVGTAAGRASASFTVVLVSTVLTFDPHTPWKLYYFGIQAMSSRQPLIPGSSALKLFCQAVSGVLAPKMPLWISYTGIKKKSTTPVLLLGCRLGSGAWRGGKKWPR